MNADASTLQALLDGGGEVVLPSGTWRVDETLWIRGSTTSVRGAGQCRIEGLNQFRVLSTDHLDPPLDLRVEDLEIVGHSDAAGSKQDHCLTVLDGGVVVVSNITAWGAWGDGIYLGTRVVDATVEGCVVRSPELEGVARNGITVSAATVRVEGCVGYGDLSGIRVEREDLGGVAVDYVDCTGVGGSSDLYVAGWGVGGGPYPIARLTRCQGRIVWVGGCDELVLDDCDVDAVRRAGVYTARLTVKHARRAVELGESI